MRARGNHRGRPSGRGTFQPLRCFHRGRHFPLATTDFPGYYSAFVCLQTRRRMDRTVAHLNIEHYRRLLAGETDESRRARCCRSCWRKKKLSSPERGRTRRKNSNANPASRNRVQVRVPPAPMRRVDVEALATRGLHPAAGNALACKDERVRAVVVEDGELQVAIKRRGRDWLPHETLVCPRRWHLALT
jgi:hypothetical protein